MSEHKQGITTTDVTHGWIATVHHGDGTSTEYWGRTSNEARMKAQDGVIDE